MENVSRRRVLTLSTALLSGVPLADERQVSTQQTSVTSEGWITKGDKTVIGEKRATIEGFQYSGMTLCNYGEVYKCRTCSGDAFYLLVSSGSPQPTVGETYRFSLTGEDDECGHFHVQLLEANSCGNSTETITTTDTPTTTETTTTETTTTDND